MAAQQLFDHPAWLLRSVNKVTHNPWVPKGGQRDRVKERDKPLWARHLSRAREDRGWSLNQVEEFTRGRIRSTTLGNYERGEREPDLEVFHILGDLYGFSPGWLAGLTRLPTLLSADEVRLVQDYRVLSERARSEFRARLTASAATERAATDDMVIRPPVRKPTVS